MSRGSMKSTGGSGAGPTVSGDPSKLLRAPLQSATIFSRGTEGALLRRAWARHTLSQHCISLSIHYGSTARRRAYVVVVLHIRTSRCGHTLCQYRTWRRRRGLRTAYAISVPCNRAAYGIPVLHVEQHPLCQYRTPAHTIRDFSTVQPHCIRYASTAHITASAMSVPRTA
eukprot:674767-Rhodomonas_salina.1